MKLAVLQMADEPQILSTKVMLNHAGYDVKVCGGALRNELQRIGCDTVLAVSHMERLGYDPLVGVEEASVKDMDSCDLFVEIKVRNVPKILSRWPRLEKHIAYWRVNGAQPEVCPKGGDEVHLPCPIITACLWYGLKRYDGTGSQETGAVGYQAGRAVTLVEHLALHRKARLGANGLAYTFWPPYPRSADYDRIVRPPHPPDPPHCVAHSARAWGYGQIIDDCVKEGVRIFGNNSPAGQLPHSSMPKLVQDSLCLVHLKSVDCPGWALYEALLAGCPVVTGRLLNSRMLAYDLLLHGETCLEFGVPASLEYGRGDMNFGKCMDDIRTALVHLRNADENNRIGENGRRRLNQLMWTAERDGQGFKEFMRGHFG